MAATFTIAGIGVQDTWLRVYNNLKSFEHRSSFSTWLTRIVINSALMILRKKRNDNEVAARDLEEGDNESLILQLPDASPNPERAYAERERSNRLNLAIGNLQPRLRRAVQFKEL